MLIDTHCHCHLHSSRFKKDLRDVVTRAVDAGVTQMVAVGCDVETSRQALAIAEAHPEVFATVGVHPCYVMEVTQADWLEQIQELAQHPRVVALGEMGLDYYHAPPEGTTWETYKSSQAEFFRKQMDLAVSLRKNIVVHQRNSLADAVTMVSEYTGRLSAQFHCFIDPWVHARPLIAQGHVISFTGIATYPQAPEVLQCAVEATAGSFMLETDSPYLTPQAKRGQRCEPAFVRITAETIAAARGVTLEVLAAETTQRARDFFGI